MNAQPIPDTEPAGNPGVARVGSPDSIAPMTTVDRGAYPRTVEVRCSEPGCARKTTAYGSEPNARGDWKATWPNEADWVLPSRTGRETAFGPDWYYATCPDHAK